MFWLLVIAVIAAFIFPAQLVKAINNPVSSMVVAKACLSFGVAFLALVLCIIYS